MLNLYKLTSPALFKLDPERAHNLTLCAMKKGVFPTKRSVVNDALVQELWGLRFPNPVGLSAGFDKNAEVIAPVLKMGFGFTEVGTVTPKPQDGNPKPRVFRDALIKRFAKTCDYLTINISSPNTPGLRNLQSREPLLELLEAVEVERSLSCGKDQPPLLVKFAPDLDDAQIEELCGTVIDGKADGVIVGNTTLDRPSLLPADFANEAGGLSGKPLTAKSTEVIGKFYQHLKGKMPIVGVGGISNADDAYAKILAGASLVQLYTGLIYQGPSIASDINKGLIKLLKRDGFSHISEAVGRAHDT